MIKIWLYSLASFFSLAALLATQRFVGGVNVQFLGESLGLVVVLLSCQICFHLNGTDDLLVDSKLQPFLQRTLKSVGAGLLVAAFLFFIFPHLLPGYTAAAASAGFLIFGLVVLRPIMRSGDQRPESEGVVILGSPRIAEELLKEIVDRETTEAISVTNDADLVRLARLGTIARVVVADLEIQPESAAAHALIDLKLRGVQIETAAESFERANRKVWVEGLSAERLIFGSGFCVSKRYLDVKRIFDIILASALLVLTAPLMVLTALVIKLDTRGPAIFSQERVGLLGCRFIVHKFRSMRLDAERKTGPTWAKENDDRVTRVGAFIRKCRIDELPQLWNVLRGEMSFAGPRPERPYFVELLKEKIPYFDLRHYVKPGITGWAQVMYPYGASVDAYHKLEYDLYYAKNLSFRLDVLILLKTIGVVVKGKGR